MYYNTKMNRLDSRLFDFFLWSEEIINITLVKNE